MGIWPAYCFAFSNKGPFAPIVKAISLLRIESSCIPGFRFKKRIIESVKTICPICDMSTQQ